MGYVWGYCSPNNAHYVGSLSVAHLWGLQVYYSLEPFDPITGLQLQSVGEVLTYTQVYPEHVYRSGVIHHVKVEGLKANTTYFYK